MCVPLSVLSPSSTDGGLADGGSTDETLLGFSINPLHNIVHLAIGWGAPQLKVGSFARSERMAKWNEALRIEQRLGDSARFAGAAAFGRCA